ncbi:MAG: SoxR reducing system RseC family protein [Bacteroidales bacterium]|nr:SoxR reducing system RseC family protein [Candidatus Physcousia equi]
MASQQIRHEGVVTSVGNGIVQVRIVQASACAACAAAKLCQSSETKEKIVEVRCNSKPYEIGQRVVLVGSLRQGLKATWLAYALPLLFVVATVAACSVLGANDALAAASALVALSVYYILIYMLRGRFEAKFGFEME